MGAEVGLVSIRWWELAMQMANTLILFLALKHFLFKPVTAFLQGREDKIVGDLEDAEKTKTQAEELKTFYQQKIDTSKEEAQKIVRDATRRGEVRKGEIIQLADEEAEKISERNSKEIARERVKAMASLKDDMVEISLAAASMVIQENIDDEGHQKLIQQYIEEMGDVHV